METSGLPCTVGWPLGKDCWTRWVRDPIQHETTHMLIKDLANVLNILYILTHYAGGPSSPGCIPLPVPWPTGNQGAEEAGKRAKLHLCMHRMHT